MQLYLKTNLKYLRKKSGKTQSGLASDIGKGATTIGNWETGVSAPSIEELAEISNYFGVKISELLEFDLEKVHLSEKDNDAENAGKSTPKSTPNGTPNALKSDTAYLDNLIKNLNEVVKSKDEVIASQLMTIAAQKTLLEHVNQQLAKLEQENDRLKRAIPELPEGVAGRSVKKTAG